MNKEKQLISVGEIINTQGNKGEVRVWPLTDFPERFKPGAVLLMEKDGHQRHLTIEKVRTQKNFLVIKFTEITDMPLAEELKTGLLKITNDQLTKLPANTYYIFEIVGMEVRTNDGQVLGKVKDVIQTGSNDVYIVAGKTKDYLIPALKQIVKDVDKENKLITVEPLEGLLDL